MFDIAPSELLLVALVALVVIGPKDLPKAMRFVGHWVGKGRGVMRQFRSGLDSMMREAELKELEERWAAENERIMREHPMTQMASTPQMLPISHGEPADQPLAELAPMPQITGAAGASAPPSDEEIAAAEGLPPLPHTGAGQA